MLVFLVVDKLAPTAHGDDSPTMRAHRSVESTLLVRHLLSLRHSEERISSGNGVPPLPYGVMSLTCMTCIATHLSFTISVAVRPSPAQPTVTD